MEKQALILREADHRMKNILTIIKAVAGLSARTSETKDEFLEGFELGYCPSPRPTIFL